MAKTDDPHKDDTAKAGRLSKRQLKSTTCWAYVKGKCADPESCTRLHVGEVIDEAAKAEKAALRKKERKKEEEEEKERKRKKEPKKTKAEKDAQAEEEKVQKRKSWLCPGCGNRNFGRREECNAATCDTMRPDNWKDLTDADHTGPPPPERNNKKRWREGDDDEDEPTKEFKRPPPNKNKKTFDEDE
eukprot:CAMPEP_0198228634 /NCGR_PEP_ID=MMETSP1445-20131203/113700_1 /TAXON_ID=36898 /ORGANISM="Pyramimonas sp., Strain CCMP2087" /LENGTH=186 /DNA_ID=CAMNT_0043909047 /DNA_START=219 /DNA_END=779 /DNA_ORIENTATION=-